MEAVIFIGSSEVARRRDAPGGLSLLDRQLKQLRSLAVERVQLLVAEDVTVPVSCVPLATSAQRVPAGDRPFAALASAAATLPSRFLFLAADVLVDLRVLRAVAAAPDDTLVRDRRGRIVPLGKLARTSVERQGAALAGATRALPLDAVDAYAPALRGTVAPYLLQVRSAAERRAAWPVLIDHAQKRGLDLPGQYFDSPFENMLVRALAPTPVTPNHVTLATMVLAGIVAWLFLRGSIVIGLALALVVGILDGVDGKLARVKLATSRLGELEHVGDFLYENVWYLTLASHLSSVSGSALLWHAGLALVACDLADNLLYGVVQARTGRFLDEISSFDARFRRIAGRRNVYVWILIVGVGLRAPMGAFLTVTAWAGATVLVHGTRAALWTWRGVGPQVPEIESVAGPLRSDR